MDEHVAVVETVIHPRGYAAMCECFWMGPWRDTRKDAEKDIERHLVEARSAAIDAAELEEDR